MAVSTTNGFDGPYTANGVTTSFPFTFTAPSTSEVAVLLRDADGVETLVSPSVYSVTLGSVSGGSVVFSTAPATGCSILPYLNPEFTQEIAFEDGSAWRATPVNEQADRSAARDQALKRDLGRSLMVPLDETVLPIPSAALRANKALFFDALGALDVISVDDFAAPAEQFSVLAGEYATTSEGYAVALSLLSAGLYYDTAADGVDPVTGVEVGESFIAWAGSRLKLYLNSAGVAVEKAEIATAAMLAALAASTGDSILASVLAGLSDSTGAGLIGTTEGVSLQDALNRRQGSPRNNKVALLGDSITAAGVDNTSVANELHNTNRGMTHWVPFLTRQKFISPQSLNFGIVGETSAQIAARVADVVASGAGTCVVIAGTNDIGALTFAQTTGNLATIYAALSAANILIIALPILPRTLAGEANYSFPQRVNEWIREQGKNYAGFKFIDPFIFGDPYSLTYSPRTGYTYDGTHPMAIGMRYLAEPVADYLNTLVPESGAQVRSVCDYFNTSNPRGCLNPNPMLVGTAGTPSGIGPIANSYNVGANAGGGSIGSLVVTCSKSVSTITQMENQKIVVSGTATGGFATNVILSLVGNIPNLSAGDTIELLADIEVAGGTIGISGIAAYAYATMVGVTKWAYDGYAVVSDDLTSDAYTGTFRTPPLVLTAAPSASGLGIGIWLKNTGTTRSCDLRINNIAVRKIV